MSTQYNGQSGNVTIAASLTISSMSGAPTNPTLITTSTSHGLTTGDFVDVSGVDGNTAANGIWKATVTSPTQISIPVASNGTYAGPNGVVSPLTIGATYAIPSDGDTRNAASVDVALEALGDRTAFLVRATGGRKLVGVQAFNTNNPGFGTTWGTILSTSTSWTVSGASPWVVVFPVVAGGIASDVIEATLTTAGSLAGASSFVGVSLGYAIAFQGGTFTPAKIPGAASYLPTAGGLVVSSGFLTAPQTGNLRLYVGHEAQAAGSTTTNLIGDYSLVVKLWRNTGANQ